MPRHGASAYLVRPCGLQAPHANLGQGASTNPAPSPGPGGQHQPRPIPAAAPRPAGCSLTHLQGAWSEQWALLQDLTPRLLALPGMAASRLQVGAVPQHCSRPHASPAVETLPWQLHASPAVATLPWQPHASPAVATLYFLAAGTLRRARPGC
jgi:hypothetical protein